ncbi:MAG: serine/threonine protein kinase [Deltaproteobacteria bacterium]|nr:serine/threonine protein kinase [Deltaproteobacteria bacterium]
MELDPTAKADNCIDDNVAAEFVSGGLAKTAVTKVEKHLASCRDCRDLVAALAGGEEDSQAATKPHDKISGSGLLMRTWTVGDRVGRYLVLASLGAGGMGVVFSAYDPQLDRKIALKLLRTNIGINTKEARARLRREAQAIAQLSHPNVVNVYDVGATEEGDVYIAMEFVEGDTLTQWLKKFARTPREIVDVFLQAARGLFAAHSVGLLHRDFKPDNVLVGGDGRVRVTDFGLARSVLGPDEAIRPTLDTTHLQVELTATGTVLGTPRYMPPEQLKGPDIDARSDQFSFCVALYEALYGSHPLPGATSVAMLEQGAKAIAPPENRGVPSTIARAVLRGLEADRSRRFPSMATLITELAPRVERSPFRFAAMGLATVIVAGAAAAAVYANRDPRPTEIPIEDNATKVLIDRINKSEEERKRLFEELKKRDLQLADLKKIQAKLVEKEAEIKLLFDQVTILTARSESEARGTSKLRPAKPQAPSQSLMVVGAIEASKFTGCFTEWAERNPRSDGTVVVRLTVGPDGSGHSAVASGPPPPLDSVALNLCVAAAATRITFPAGPEELDVQATIGWSDGMITLAAKVIGQRAVPQTGADFAP